MRRCAYLSSVALLLTGVVSTLPAQSYSGAGVTYAPPVGVGQPGCNTPGTIISPRPTTVPYASPSAPSNVTRPYTPGTLPSTPGGANVGSVPSTTPSLGAGVTPGFGGGVDGAIAAPVMGDSRGDLGSDSLASSTPTMIGDLVGGGFGAIRPRNGNGYYYRSSTGQRVALVNRSGIKIAENESPRPLDRVYLTYNYYNNLFTNGYGRPDLHRGVIGFEKTFLDGDASIGMRLPFLQGDGAGAVNMDGFGDLSVILKYAFVNDRDTGTVVSGGLAVAIPTGISVLLDDGSRFNSVLLQPWGGFILPFGDFYAHGFTSCIIPTESRDVVLYTADVGVGYRLYQNSDPDAILRAIIPTVEGHLNIPLSNAGPTDLIYFPDTVILTGGVHFGIGSRSWFTLGAAMPVTGPKLYDFECMGYFNCIF